jgi:hypothetical protein
MKTVNTPSPHTGSATSLPALVEETVAAHFGEYSDDIEASIRGKIEDAHLRILNRFFTTIQSSYAQRIAALEATTHQNNETLRQIRGHSERAEDDLQRLAAGIQGLIGAPVTGR